MSGFVKLHRKVRDNALLGANHDARHLFFDLLELAAWKDTVQDWRGQPVQIERGQIMVSTRRLSEESGFGHQQVRTLLKYLATHDIVKINTLPNQGPTIITICNYSKYQDCQHTPNTPANTPLTHSQHTKEEVKKYNNNLTLSLEDSQSAIETPSDQLVGCVSKWMNAYHENERDRAARQWIATEVARTSADAVKQAVLQTASKINGGDVIAQPLRYVTKVATSLHSKAQQLAAERPTRKVIGDLEINPDLPLYAEPAPDLDWQTYDSPLVSRWKNGKEASNAH